jgi:hypothetical protein
MWGEMEIQGCMGAFVYGFKMKTMVWEKQIRVE